MTKTKTIRGKIIHIEPRPDHPETWPLDFMIYMLTDDMPKAQDAESNWSIGSGLLPVSVLDIKVGDIVEQTITITSQK